MSPASKHIKQLHQTNTQEGHLMEQDNAKYTAVPRYNEVQGNQQHITISEFWCDHSKQMKKICEFYFIYVIIIIIKNVLI